MVAIREWRNGVCIAVSTCDSSFGRMLHPRLMSPFPKSFFPGF